MSAGLPSKNIVFHSRVDLNPRNQEFYISLKEVSRALGFNLNRSDFKGASSQTQKNFSSAPFT